MKKKVIISACLLGEYCRYDGETKKVSEVVDAFKEYEIIPFCPEAPIFGTPRERINVVKIEGGNRIITEHSAKDVTKLLEDEISSFIEKNPEADAIVLKSKSPSCGLSNATLLDKDKKFIGFTNGMAADMFMKHYTSSEISDELDYTLANEDDYET